MHSNQHSHTRNMSYQACSSDPGDHFDLFGRKDDQAANYHLPRDNLWENGKQLRRHLRPNLHRESNQDDGIHSDAFEDSDLDVEDFADPDVCVNDHAFGSEHISTISATNENDHFEHDLEDDELDSALCSFFTPGDSDLKRPITSDSTYLPASSYFNPSQAAKHHSDEVVFDSLSDGELYDAAANLPDHAGNSTDEVAYDTDDSLFDGLLVEESPVTSLSHSEISKHEMNVHADESANSNDEPANSIAQSLTLNEMKVTETQERDEAHNSSDEDHVQNSSIVMTYPPLTRSSFPLPVLDRSPIDSITPMPNLKTCFRAGHALQTGVAAYRRNIARKTLLEIYARVALSYREVDDCGTFNGRQIFELADLFHDHPPVLYGVYEGWLGVPLLEEDTRAFLNGHVDGEMRMCRCIAHMERENRRWKLAIRSIWEAEWDDILHVYGTVTA